jgi:hypothetical protein
MKLRSLEALEVMSRRRYARRNFLTTYLGGNEQNRRVEVATLHKQGHLVLHPPNAHGSIERSYPHYFFRIYEKPHRNEHKALQFWHQVLVDDILISIETACKRAALTFRDRDDVLAGRALKLPCSIEHTIDGELHKSSKTIEPDAIFSINDTYFVLEADRGTEPVLRNNLNETSYLKKLLQYRDVLKNQTYKKVWNIPNMIVLNITTKAERVQSLTDLMVKLNITSKSLTFAGYPSLASSVKAPQPILSILTDPFLRVGHDPFIIGKEVI